MSEQRCGTRALLAVNPDTDGVARVRKDKMYQCRFPAPDLPILPISLTIIFKRHYVETHDGATCPVYRSRPRQPRKVQP